MRPSSNLNLSGSCFAKVKLTPAYLNVVHTGGAADAPEMPVDTDYQRTVSAAPNVLGKAQ